MKHLKKVNQTLFLVLLIGLSAQALGQFQGKMVFKTMDKEMYFVVHSCDAGYRYDFEEDGQQGAVIVKGGSGEVIILMPQQKMAMKSSAASPMGMTSDPLSAWEYYKQDGLLEEEGKEVINGIECTKSVLWNKENPDQKLLTIWFSDQYKFPIKMVNHIDGNEDSGMEMKDMKPWTPDESLLSIPEGYQVMEMPAGMPGN
jgi:hypothetical protein